jgi:2-methylcitrate dehydratase PrpD
VLAWTLADFLACVLGTALPSDVRPWAFDDDGVSGTASALALRASWRDRDDVDWASLTHPGSVAWSTVLATAPGRGPDGPTVARAAYAGYRAIATMAERLGPAHRASWHATATAGGFGAAAAAGVVLGLTPEEQSRAFSHVAAGTGGLGQAAVERQGAAAFNRAAAVGLGIQAVRAAVFGAVPISAPLEGERALLALTGGDPADGRDPELVDGLARVGPRVYPVSGFGQGAVFATATLRARCAGTLRELVVDVAEPAARLMDGSARGTWWSLPEAVSAAWATGDPFALSPSEASQALVRRVRTVVGDVPVGAARVRAVTDLGTEVAEAAPPAPGPDLNRKWSTMLAAAGAGQDVVALAAGILRQGVTMVHLDLLTAPRPTERPR